MLVHTVLFWLKKDLSQAQQDAFRAGLETLLDIPAVEAAFIGTPAGTPVRPVIDTTYSYMLTVLLQDVAAHDAYQDDPIHLAFVDKHKVDWDRVQIFDAE